jgi:hypothetical protein
MEIFQKKTAGDVPAALGKLMVWLEISVGLATRFAKIHLEIAEVDLRVALALFRFFVNLGPPFRVGLEHPRLAEAFTFALAIDTGIGVRKRVEPCFSDFPITKFAAAIDPSGDTLEGMLDLAQLTTFDFHELRADLIVRGIDSRIDVIADHAELRKPPEAVEVAIKGFSQGIAPGDQPGGQS